MTKDVRKRLLELNVHVVFIPASLTWKYQLVDVLLAAILKKYIAKFWSAWMCNRLLGAYDKQTGFRPLSSNYIQPSMVQCVIWSNAAILKIKNEMKEQMKRCADKLYMGKKDTEMEPFMADYYAGKFKCSYETPPPDAVD